MGRFRRLLRLIEPDPVPHRFRHQVLGETHSNRRLDQVKPDFFYPGKWWFSRVIGIPTPRWTAYDAKRLGTKLPKEAPIDHAGARLHFADLVHAVVRRSLAAFLLGISSSAMACGFHDEVSLQRGLMNWIYPESLHVRAAVWRAQQVGQIDREELAYLKVAFLLRAFAPRLAPNTSVVLLRPMLWTRYGPEGVRVHADGAGEGDTVLVTEAAVVKAIVEERLTLADALERSAAHLSGALA